MSHRIARLLASTAVASAALAGAVLLSAATAFASESPGQDAEPSPAVAPEAAPQSSPQSSPYSPKSTPPSPQEGLRQVDFFIGQWDVEGRSADGSRVVSRARTEVRYILDGTAMQADYYGLDPAGNTVFRGTTIRTYVAQTGRFAVHWAMANRPGYTYLDEEYRDGELHAEGGGFDDQGTFRERYRYYDISEASYTFTISRSYDDGETWKPWVLIEAERAEPASPSDAGPAD